MLTDADLERMFINFGTPGAGRELVRQIRRTGPVRDVQQSMNTVRTRFMSKKMDRALFAESRTVELPGIYVREFDDDTIELWPQPCKFDLLVETPSGRRTRVQHTPDLFLICSDGFLIEEWRDEERLKRLASEMPHRYYKDTSGRWHDQYVERHLAPMNISYHLRSAEEHNEVWLSNLRLLEDFTLETTRPVPFEESQRLLKLLKQERKVAHLDLLYKHNFNAEHIFQMVLLKDVYVDLDQTPLRNVDDLVIYSDETAGRADAIFREPQNFASPSCVVDIYPGMQFVYDGETHNVVIVGKSGVTARTPSNHLVELSRQEISNLVKGGLVKAAQGQMTRPEINENAVLQDKRTARAVKKMEMLANPEAFKVPGRTLRRWKAKTRELQVTQQILLELMSKNPGNTHRRIPDEQYELARQVAEEHFNTAEAPTVSKAFSTYIAMADEAGTKAMSRSSFYELMGRLENTEARHGKKRAYQDAALPLYHDYGHPVHGVLPHEIVYIDHTPLPILLRGRRIRNLGKPTLTLATDGAVSCPRAFFLSFKNAKTLSVLMCLRDYVRRHGCLPRVIVVDNGKEFHSRELEAFASIFNIEIRWRRASQPRDSTKVERALGITQQEITDNLKGTSKALRDPRSVSATHQPEEHIESTLKSLHGSLDNYFFKTLMGRTNAAIGMPPKDFEVQLHREFGERRHRAVAYDDVFKLLSSPHPKYAKPRKLDDRRGVWMDGAWHWHPSFALARPRETVEVRTEPWNAQIAYVLFRGEWLIATARDNGILLGRFEDELEYQRKHERVEAQAQAQRDKVKPKHAKERMESWNPKLWDEFLREQGVEEYRLYVSLGMVEALPGAQNKHGLDLDLGIAKQSVDAGPAATVTTKAAGVQPTSKTVPAQDEVPEFVNAEHVAVCADDMHEEEDFDEEVF